MTTFLPTMVAAPPLLGGDVASCAAAFTPRGDAADAAARLGIALPDSLGRAVDKRVSEYVAGRYCAREALRRLGIAAAAAPGVGPDRAPVWPTGIVGAITHTDGFAWAAAASASACVGLGIDSEALPAAARATSIRSMVLNDAEYGLLAETLFSEFGESVAAVLAFSAKECVYKCVTPATGVSLGFSDACVTAVDRQAGRLILRLTRAVGSAFPMERLLTVRFLVAPTRVCTALACRTAGTAYSEM